MKQILDTINDYSSFISLLLSAIAVFIAIVSLIRSERSEKAMIRRIIFEKEAEISAIENVYFNEITTHRDLPNRNDMEVKVKCLKKQVEYLKQRR